MFGMREHHLADGRVGLGQGRLVGRLPLLQLGLAGDLGRGVLAALLRLGDRLGGGVALGAGGLDARPAARAGARRASRNSSTSRTASSPRRASAAFVPSGSARICRTSSIRARESTNSVQEARDSVVVDARHRPAGDRVQGGVGVGDRHAQARGLEQLDVVRAVAERDDGGRIDRRAARTRTRAPSPCSRPGSASSRKIGSDLAMNAPAVEPGPQLVLEAGRAAAGSPDDDDLRRRPVEPCAAGRRRRAPRAGRASA